MAVETNEGSVIFTYKYRERMAEVAKEALKEILKIENEFLNEAISVVQDYRTENQKLRIELLKVKEEKAENELMYERIIRNYQEKLERRS